MQQEEVVVMGESTLLDLISYNPMSSLPLPAALYRSEAQRDTEVTASELLSYNLDSRASKSYGCGEDHVHL